MKINKESFLKVLNTVAPALSEKAMIEGTDRFIFIGNKIVTYNDRICIFVPFKFDWKCSLPAKELRGIISAIKEEEIDFDLVDGKMTMNTAGTESVLSVFESDDVLKMVDSLNLKSIKNNWKELPGGFSQGANLCMFSVSRDVSSKYLSSLFFQDNKIVSSDDIRVSSYEMDGEVKDPFLLPYYIVPDLLKFDFVKYFLGDSWVYFSTEEGLLFCCRRVIADYPEMDKFFNIKGKRVRLPKDLKQLVDGISTIAEGDFEVDQKIKVTIGNEKIKCKAEKSIAKIKQEMDIKYRGKEFSFFINPTFFSQILEKSTIMICGENRAEFVSGSFKHLLLFFNEPKK